MSPTYALGKFKIAVQILDEPDGTLFGKLEKIADEHTLSMIGQHDILPGQLPALISIKQRLRDLRDISHTPAKSLDDLEASIRQMHQELLPKST